MSSARAAASREIKTTTCYMCACRCGIRVHVEIGEVRYIEGNPEYESKGQGKGSIMIYHCPFCGGAAPESQRGKLFAAIPRQEEERLYGLFEDSKTIEDVLEKFGPPDQDHARGVGVQTPEKDNNVPTSERFRTLVYSKLSDVADVHVTDYNKDRVHIMLLGKYVGKP